MTSERTPPAEDIDERFRRAVAAIDAGDIATLARMLAAHPRLACDRLASPGAWLRDAVGGALDDFFREPYLLWFVAEDPVRNGTLPANIAVVARAIVEAARRAGASSLQEQLDHALALVSWSWIARQCGVQLELIDVLADAGAVVDGNPDRALVNGNVAAAEHLVARGARLTLATALCLGRWDAADRLATTAGVEEMRYAVVLSALRGMPEALRRLIRAGADVNARSASLFAHGTPLHHAVSSGSLGAVRVLVDAGADLRATDSAWGGTPLGWAEHALGEGNPNAAYAEIAAYLRAKTDER